MTIEKAQKIWNDEFRNIGAGRCSPNVFLNEYNRALKRFDEIEPHYKLLSVLEDIQRSSANSLVDSLLHKLDFFSKDTINLIKQYNVKLREVSGRFQLFYTTGECFDISVDIIKFIDNGLLIPETNCNIEILSKISNELSLFDLID